VLRGSIRSQQSAIRPLRFALPPRKQLASDIADPIPKRLLQRAAEFFADAFDLHQHLIITSTHILKSIHPKHIPYLIYSDILKNVGASAVFC
jgi:hypothetical protein